MVFAGVPQWVDAQQTVDIFIPILLLTPEVRALTLPSLSLTAVSLPSTTFNEDLNCFIHKSNLTGLEVNHFSATLCLRPKLALFIQVHLGISDAYVAFTPLFPHQIELIWVSGTICLPLLKQ